MLNIQTMISISKKYTEYLNHTKILDNDNTAYTRDRVLAIYTYLAYRNNLLGVMDNLLVTGIYFNFQDALNDFIYSFKGRYLKGRDAKTGNIVANLKVQSYPKIDQTIANNEEDGVNMLLIKRLSNCFLENTHGDCLNSETPGSIPHNKKSYAVAYFMKRIHGGDFD